MGRKGKEMDMKRAQIETSWTALCARFRHQAEHAFPIRCAASAMSSGDRVVTSLIASYNLAPLSGQLRTWMKGLITVLIAS